MFVASELATAGSVIKKALRIVPDNGRGGGKRAVDSFLRVEKGFDHDVQKTKMKQVSRKTYQRRDNRHEEDRTAPSSSGVSHLALCSALP